MPLALHLSKGLGSKLPPWWGTAAEAATGLSWLFATGKSDATRSAQETEHCASGPRQKEAPVARCHGSQADLNWLVRPMAALGGDGSQAFIVDA